MIALEVVGAVVLVLLVAGATWMAIVGLLGAVGAVRLGRCRACGHLLVCGLLLAPGVCPYCRHPWLVRHVMHVHLRHLLPEEMVRIRPHPPVQGTAEAGSLRR